MSICVFEDFSKSTLLPLTHVQPDFDLRCGVFTNRERLVSLFPDAELQLFARIQLADALRERSGLTVNTRRPDTELFLNGSVMLKDALRDTLLESWGEDRLVFSGTTLVAAMIASDALRGELHEYLKAALLRSELTSGSPTSANRLRDAAEVTELECAVLRFPWDLVTWNTEMLRLDARRFELGVVAADARCSDSVIIEHETQVSIGTGTVVGAGVVIDATDGPVVIGDRVRIMPQALIMGPAFIGDDSVVKAAAKIYAGSSIGPVCKVGGEIEGSIFHSYANKQHDGFVGHSYFASWTNLGADTNTSDLKNNYSNVRMTLEGNEHDTGLLALGTIMAEHAKCGINTMFNTGTCVGVGCNVYGGDFPPKFLPSFSWGGAAGVTEHDFERCCATAAVVMQRRDRSLTQAEKSLLRDVFVATSEQRKTFSITE